MKRVVCSTAKRFSDIIDTNKYNMKTIRSLNVTVGSLSDWIEALEYFNVDTPKDPTLYALEFSSRAAGRFGERRLPNVKGNEYSGCSYYLILPRFLQETDEEQQEDARNMIEYLVRTIRPSTLDKWVQIDI